MTSRCFLWKMHYAAKVVLSWRGGGGYILYNLMIDKDRSLRQ